MKISAFRRLATFLRSSVAPVLFLIVFASIFSTASVAATLYKTNFETANPWTTMAGYFTTGGGTVTASPTWTTVGTIDTYGSGTSSSGLQLVVNSSAATGNWTAGLNSGILTVAANTRAKEFISLAFSLSASSAYPVRVKVESYDAAGTNRTGGLATLIFPAGPDFYQRYAIDLDKMTPDGAGTFVPSATKIRIYFELDSTANGTGWPVAAAHSLKIDNVNYSTPKYYVKPASIGGSDSKSGADEANALATVQAAVNKTFSGDNIIAIMEDNTVGGEDYLSSDVVGNSFNHVNNDMVNISKPGTPDAWIVFKNYPGQTPVLKCNGWNVFRVCNNSSGGAAAYIEVRGITMRGYSYVDANGDRQIKAEYEPYIGLTDSRTNGNGFGVDGGFNKTNYPHDLRVADCTMEYLAGSNGGSGDRQTFENNIIRYNAWWMKYAGSGISFGFATDAETGANYRRLIRNNVVYGNECMVPWRRSTSNPYSDGNGIIMDSDTAGYTGKTLILNNLVYNNGGSGIHVLKCSNVDVVHNTAYFNSASSSEAYGQIFTQSFSDTAGLWVKNVNVTNNIMVAPKRDASTTNSYLFNEAATSVASSDPTTIVHKRNVYVGGDNTPSLSGANLSDNTDRGRSYDPALIFMSPSIDPAAADFRLRSAAATNYGATVGYRSVRDLANSPRSLTGATDTGAYQTLSTVAYQPIFSPKAGNYSGAQSVTLTSDTAGAKIVYTTNGSTPTVDASGNTTNGTTYSVAIPVSAATTIKAIAWKSGLTASTVSNAPYTFQDLSSIPVTLSVQAPTGIYPGTQYSQPLTRTPGALFRYTTNGTDPTYNVANPSASLGIPQDYRGVTVLDYATLRYQAYKPGRANSAIVSTNITVRASVGNTSDGTALTSFGAGNIRFVRFHPTNYFSAAYIFARVNGTTGGYRAALYSDSAATPATLLASSSLVSNPATGWTAFPLATRVTLNVKDSSNADQYFWLAIWSDSASAGIYATATGGTVREEALTFSSTWPNPAGTSTAVSGTANPSIYATNAPPNLAPVVNAGADQNLATGSTANLSGSVSDDGVPVAPGTVTSLWSQISGPGTASIANPASASTTATFPANGTYVFRLTSRDALATASDDITIDVSAGGGVSLDPNPPNGVVRARFSDGGGSTYPQQYPGTAGSGWAAGWVASGTTPVPNVSVINTAPLNAGGYYLTVARNGGSGGGLAGVYREWSTNTTSGRPGDQFSRLTFDLRVEPTTFFTAINDTINVTARPTSGATSGADSTFFIRAFGAAPATIPAGQIPAQTWCVYNGDGVTGTNAGAYDINRFVSTGMTCVPGKVYSFTVDLYGAPGSGTTGGKAHGTYDVTIRDVAAGTSVTSSNKRFRSATYNAGSFLSFAMSQDTPSDNLAFSVDSVEMNSLTLMESLTSSANPANFGSLVTFTAKINNGGGSPTGNVTFRDGSSVLGTDSLDASLLATFATSALTAGAHSITASYTGSESFTASTSAPLVQNILSATTTTLDSNLNPANLGDSVTFNITVDGDNGTPTGSVTLFNDGVSLGNATLDGLGAASFTTNALSVGLHSLVANYNGDVGNSAGSSDDFIQTIQLPDGTTRVLAINAAGPGIAGSGFVTDYAFSGGAITTTANAINIGAVTRPAPSAVYQTGRSGGNFSYTLSDFAPSAACLVRLHFSENYWGVGVQLAQTSGRRLINVSINGSQRLAAFDIWAAASASNKAVIREFIATSNSSGQIILNLSVAAASLDPEAIIQGLEIYTATPFDAWRAANFTPAQLDNSAISGLFSDPDGDKINNLLEYSLSLNPLLAGTSGLPVVGQDGVGHLTLTFLHARGDITYTVEGSSDLQTWTTVPGNMGSVGETVTISDTAPLNGGPRFLRLRVAR